MGLKSGIFAELNRIWQNLAEISRIWQDWQNMAEFGKIWQNLTKSSRILLATLKGGQRRRYNFPTYENGSSTPFESLPKKKEFNNNSNDFKSHSNSSVKLIWTMIGRCLSVCLSVCL